MPPKKTRIAMRPSELAEFFLNFVPYAGTAYMAEEIDKRKGKADRLQRLLRAEAWMYEASKCGSGPEVVTSLSLTEMEVNKWAEYKSRDAEGARASVAEAVRHVVLRVTSGNAVIALKDLAAILGRKSNISTAKKPSARALLEAALGPLKELWGLEVVPLVTLSNDDAGIVFQQAGDFLARLLVEPKAKVGRGKVAGEGADHRRLRLAKRSEELAFAASDLEMARRGVLSAVLGAIAATKRQFLSEEGIFAVLASSGDPSFVRQAEAAAAGGGGGAGSKRAREEEAGEALPGGLPLKELLKEFVAQKWLLKDRVAAAEAATEGGGEGGAGAGNEEAVEVYRAGPRARMTLGPIGAVDLVQGVTEDGGALVRDKLAIVLASELAEWIEAVPKANFEVTEEEEIE